MGRVEGKVAFITGAARGQGRSHAVRLAEEGANIIAVDLCKDIETIGYPMATPEDLEETKNYVEKTGQKIVTAQADVRDASALKAALEAGLVPIVCVGESLEQNERGESRDGAGEVTQSTGFVGYPVGVADTEWMAG